ncbi:MAG: 23S rRNA (uracil(1939)-C(5))-methyltransferase RlmD [Desulfovibrionaceae bacterium]|nr:23S rRNA (uracil(1939)-C(5))-methyltransferase RlmD [Desulfovibrionaceae bacterium]
MSDLLPTMGAELELEVTDLNVDGGAVGRHGGVVCFLDHALPGSRVRAVVEAVKKRRVEARVLETLRPSPWEERPFCSYFGVCGGCAWQDLSYTGQLEWKRGRLEAALQRIAGLSVKVPPLTPSPRLQAFRNKVEYAFAPGAGGEPLLGLRQKFSHALCPVEVCALQSAASGKILGKVRAWAGEWRLRAWERNAGCLRYFILREPKGNPERMAELVCGDEAPPEAAGRALWDGLRDLGVGSFLISRRRSARDLARGEERLELFGSRSLGERLGDLWLEFPAWGFMQTNPWAAELLYSRARELAGLSGGGKIWDLYAGVGGLGFSLSREAAELVGVEIEEEAARAAEDNARRLGLGSCRFVAGDAATILPELPGRPDLLILDPPRSGLDRLVIAAIKAKVSPGLLYVSCDPAALARDLTLLAPEYGLAAIEAVDFFPHTPHVESVALLRLN